MVYRTLACSVMLAFALAPVGAQPAPGKEELKLKLPKPMFVGTPTNIRSPNLEKVTSSDSAPVIGELDMITDGEKNGGDGFFVELGPTPQWIQIDLGASRALHAILVWHYHSQARVYRDVVAQVSDDPAFKTGVTTVYNNDHDNSAKLGAGTDKEYIEVAEGRLIDPKGAKGRYVRLYSNGNTTNDLSHYVEVEVYGSPK